jgi:predicted HAD superfamily hydrolase
MPRPRSCRVRCSLRQFLCFCTWYKSTNTDAAEATLVQGQIFALHNNETTSVQKIKIGIGAQITGFTTGFTSTKVPILTREAWT